MKIKSLAISNSLSFALQDPPLTPNISFQTPTTQGSRHILIGPNGAGKSNFIELVNLCFRRGLFLPVQVDESILMRGQQGEFITQDQLRQVFSFQNPGTNWPPRHHDGSITDVQTIELLFELNDNDFRNLEFLSMHAVELNEILGKYSNIPAIVPLPDLATLRSHSAISVTFTYRRSEDNLTVAFASDGEPVIDFIKTYLRHFRAFQVAISLYNRYFRPSEQEQWSELKETFAMLGSYRNYAGINNSIGIEANRSFQSAYDRLRNESTRSGGSDEPAVFEMVKRKIGYAFYDLYDLQSRADSLTRLYNEEPLLSINKFLLKYLDLQIQVSKPSNLDMRLEFHFERADGRRIDVADLSSGEKGILHFIFTLFGFDLENGVIVIDEPELHLHPQIQQEYKSIIGDVLNKLDIQFIIATHSPLFVDVDTIEQVYRFFRTDGQTQIVHPTITAPQKALVQILNLTNSAKIFFVNRVILVEGETDEYFVRCLLDYLKSTANDSGAEPWQMNISDYEVVNIKGKGGRAVWTDFLLGFGLKVSFIGDWDNITEVASFDLAKYSDLYRGTLKTAGDAIQKKGSADGAALFGAVDKVLVEPSSDNLKCLSDLKEYIVARTADYPKLIGFIRTNDPDELARLEGAIAAAYDSQLFILSQGELENYLGITKGIDQVIELCRSRLSSWITDTAYSQHREELYRIFAKIFG